MEPAEVDIKPTTPDDISDKTSLSVVGKLKHSRYEDVWPEDVHAAFMEAVALYPPMGKRRLKYYRVSSHEDERSSDANQTKSFGRCQLIQSYILEKTGKNRSRKQVSSHLQRLKKIHKDNPAMQPLFSERSQPPSEHRSVPQAISSQDVSTSTSVSTRHLKSDLGPSVNLHNMDTGAIGPSTFIYAVEASSFDDGSESCNSLNLSTNLHDQPSFQQFLSPVPQQYPDTLHPSNSNYFSQDALLFKDGENEGFRPSSAFNTSTFSTSTQRLVSKLPIQYRLADSGSAMHFSRAVHSLGFQPTQWISHESLMDGVSCNSPFISYQDAFHTPFLPQLIPSEKRLYPCPASEWTWLKNADPPLDPREGPFSEIRLRYPPAIYKYDSRFHSPSFESEGSQLSRGTSYSHAAASPATVSESASNENATDLLKQPLESSESLVPPFVIRPTPMYPISYIHSDVHSNVHSDSHTPVLSLAP